MLLREATPGFAVTLAGILVVHNVVFLPRWAPSLLRSPGRAPDAGIVTYPIVVLGLVLAFHARLELAAAAWGILAFGDGLADPVGRRARRSLPWNPGKTWAGSLAFLVAGTAAGAALLLWVAPGNGRGPGDAPRPAGLPAGGGPGEPARPPGRQPARRAGGGRGAGARRRGGTGARGAGLARLGRSAPLGGRRERPPGRRLGPGGGRHGLGSRGGRRPGHPPRHVRGSRRVRGLRRVLRPGIGGHAPRPTDQGSPRPGPGPARAARRVARTGQRGRGGTPHARGPDDRSNGGMPGRSGGGAGDRRVRHRGHGGGAGLGPPDHVAANRPARAARNARSRLPGRERGGAAGGGTGGPRRRRRRSDSVGPRSGRRRPVPRWEPSWNPWPEAGRPCGNDWTAGR